MSSHVKYDWTFTLSREREYDDFDTYFTLNANAPWKFIKYKADN